MDPVWAVFFVLVAAFAAWLWWGARTLHGPADAAWEAAARELGLTFRPGSRMAGRTLSGQIGDFEVEACSIHQGWLAVRHSTRLRVRGPGIPAGLSLPPGGFIHQIQGAQSYRHLLAALLAASGETVAQSSARQETIEVDEDARARFEDFLKRGGWADQGTLFLLVPELILDSRSLVSRLRDLVELAARLEILGTPVPRRLLRHATSDPAPADRHRFLRQLVGGFPRSLEADAACRWTVAHDADSETLLFVAEQLGSEGEPILDRLVDAPGAADPTRIAALVQLKVRLPEEKRFARLARAAEAGSPAVKVAALRELIAAAPTAFLIPALERAVEDPVTEVRRPAIRELGFRHHRPAYDRLVKLLERNWPDTTADITNALGNLGGEQTEPVLLQLLGHESFEVKKEAAEALGKVGTLTAVGPLSDYAAEDLTGPAAKLSIVARAAIKAIQGRLRGVDRGRLSLAQPAGEVGALSLSTDEGGLSLAEEPPAAAAPPAKGPPPAPPPARPEPGGNRP